MRLAFWQGEFPVSVAVALENLEALVLRAKAEKADLIVFPELYLGGYLLEDATSRALTEADLSRLQSIASSQKIAIVVGYFEREQHDSDGDLVLYNSAMAIDSGGAVVSNYRKSHLFGAAEKRAFSPGDKLCEPFDIAGIKAAMSICYDVEFPETARLAALGGAQILIVPTANMHPYDKVNDIIIPSRAVENHIFVCYCNWAAFVSSEGVRFNGRSSVCGPTGDFLAKFHDETGLKFVDIETQQHANEDEYLKDRRPEIYQGLI